MIWLVLLGGVLLLVILFEFWRPSDPMFEEARRRERAMKTLEKHYDPSNDIVLKQQEQSHGT